METKKNKTMSKKVFLYLTVAVFLISLGFVIGYYSNLYLSPLQFKANRLFQKNFPKPVEKDVNVHIPVTFLPASEPDGKLSFYSHGEFLVHTDNLALVLVDTWDAENDTPSMVQKISKLLQKCRETGVTVIHAPNYPTVNKYPQYQTLKKISRLALAESHQRRFNIPFLQWPKTGDNISKKAAAYRINARRSENQKSWHERVIAESLEPLSTEFVVNTYEELKYVLWQRKIQTLLYVGGAVNGCMLHRETGIYRISGIAINRAPFTIIVLEDCVKAMQSARYSEIEMCKAMMEYYRLDLAFLSSFEQMTFSPHE